MVNIARKDLIAKAGKSNTIHGTDQKDIITINGHMKTLGGGASNLIHLHNGSDNLWIGSKMWAFGGRNTILGDNDRKNLTIKSGMDATKGGTNEIILYDNIVHFTTRHNLTIGSVKADYKGENLIVVGGNADDRLAFTGYFKASSNGQNVVELADGSKHVSFAHGWSSSSGGKNILDMGVGNQNVTFGGSVHAGNGGKNQIISKGGNSTIHIKHSMDAVGNNDFYLGEGKNKLVVDSNVLSHAKGRNNIVSEGETTILVKGAVKSYGVNQIETGSYNDVITINKGLYAYGRGINQISTGDGHDKVYIKGHITAGIHNTNIIDLGKGNDTLHLNAYVARKDLVIDAGEGYDTLILEASNAHSFKSQYYGWFVDSYKTSGLIGSSLEEIKVDITRGINLNQIDWLTKVVNNHNAGFGDDIAISLALDNAGARIDLGDIFTPRDESSISIIDLTGGNRNELRIHDTLASNDYDGNQLRINGDSNDRVGIDSLWTNSGGFVHENQNYYHVWNNAYGESLLIQDGVDIHVY